MAIQLSSQDNVVKVAMARRANSLLHQEAAKLTNDKKFKEAAAMLRRNA